MPEQVVVMLSPHGDPLGRIGEPDIGGQCVYIRELATHLARSGTLVRVYTRDRNDGKPPREEFAHGAVLIRIPCGPEGFVPKEIILPYLDEFAEHVSSELAGDEILHSHYWDGGYVARALRTDQRWFHTTHSIGKLKQAALPDQTAYRYEDRIRIEADVYRNCYRVIALTELEKEQISDLYDVPEEQIVTIPPGVDTNVFRPQKDKEAVRRRLGLPDSPTVFALGRLDERKGFDLFLRAAAECVRRMGDSPVTFVLSAGDHRPEEAVERAKLTRLVNELSLNGSLVWLPVLPEEEIPHYYGASNVFALPSRYEPFGIVMLEAMACAVPVVATREGGPAKVIEHGVDGLLIDPMHTEQFAGGILALLESPHLQVEYGRRARRKAVTDYSWRSIAQRHVDAYELRGDGGPYVRG